MAELDEDPLVLRAVEIDLGDVRHAQQMALQPLGDALEVGIGRPFTGQGVEHGIDVAELVVDIRADEAARQVRLQVVELLAHLVEELRHVARRGGVAEHHLDRREAGLGIGLRPLEIGQFLQLLLDPLGHLVLHLAGGGARPGRGDGDHLDGEGRILRLPEPQVRDDAGRHHDEDGEEHQRPVRHRPVGPVALGQGGVVAVMGGGHGGSLRGGTGRGSVGDEGAGPGWISGRRRCARAAGRPACGRQGRRPCRPRRRRWRSARRDRHSRRR